MNRRTAPRQPVPTPTPGTPADEGIDIDRLDAVMATLTDEHRTLLELAKEHRAALIGSDAEVLKGVVQRTGCVLARIRAAETQRQRLAVLPDGRTGTIADVVKKADSVNAKRLTDRAATLRELIGLVKVEHEAVRAASEALATHMRGLIQQVSSRLSHAGTYGRAGRVEPACVVMTGVDIGA